MEMLILLVRRGGRLVTRKEIEASLWGSRVFVERDSAINTAIRKIRQALDDCAERPRFVETVVGKGYRFIAPIDRDAANDSPLSGVDLPRAGGSVRFPRYAVVRGNREFVLEPGENLLGRDPDARVYIDHPSVSRRHARLSLHENRVFLEDLKSRNGTFLDGRRIEVTTEIGHGAIVGLGPITLTFVVLSGPASTRPMRGTSWH